MGELVNLRQERKRKERDRKAKKADANRAKHGRSRGERSLADAEHQKSDRHLDAHRITAPDASGASSVQASDGDPSLTSSGASIPTSEEGASTPAAAKPTAKMPNARGKNNVVSIFAPNIPDRK